MRYCGVIRNLKALSQMLRLAINCSFLKVEL